MHADRAHAANEEFVFTDIYMYMYKMYIYIYI